MTTRHQPTGEDMARLLADFMERFEVYEAQTSQFRTFARKIVEQIKKQGAHSTTLNTDATNKPKYVTLNEANNRSTDFHEGDSVQHINSFQFSDVHKSMADALNVSGFLQEDTIEEEWVNKMDFNAPLPNKESQFIGKTSTKNMIFEAMEDSKKSKKNLAESIHDLTSIHVLKSLEPPSRSLRQSVAERLKQLPASPPSLPTGDLANSSPVVSSDIKLSRRKSSKQNGANIRHVTLNDTEDAPPIPTETASATEPHQKHVEPEQPIKRPESLKKKLIIPPPKPQPVNEPSPPPPVTKFGKLIKKTMVEAAYNDRGSNVSIHDHVIIRDKQRNAVFDLDPHFIWNHGLNAMSSFSVGCEFSIFVICLSELILLPLAISYDFRLPLFYSCIISIKNTLDIALELITMRFNHPAMENVKDPNMSDWREYYCKRVLAIDIITVFPFELLPVEGAHYLWAFRLLRIHKLPFIARTSPILAKLRKLIFSTIGVGQAVYPIFPMACILFLFMHFQACVIFLAGRLFEFSNDEIEPYKDAAIFDQYMWSLYMSATNIFPLGYHPVNSVEQFITVVFVICGAGLYACIVGAISSIAIGIDASGRLYKQKIDELKEYMHWKAVEPVTQRKVLKYYELKYRGKYFEEAELLNRMNESLRMEISIHNCRELISKVPFLRREQGDGRDDLFAGRITSALEPCYYVPGDTIFVQGEIGHDMYFIFSGAVLVSISGKGVAILRDGAFFGEIALVANIPRTATVQAVSSCVLYRLSQESFATIMSAFDDVKKKVDNIYIERMEKIRLDEETRKLQIAVMLSSKIPFMAVEFNDAKVFVEKLAAILVSVTLSPDDLVCTQGKAMDALVCRSPFLSLTADFIANNSTLLKRGNYM
ncbi:UNVERIFIED_CONTAM: hypothetical protein HDU68_009997 [Siphonaria sp. JEL0065]|nr:hypothetical protein HDU68_009997 [Siphonaria sp. JEL0065]